MTNITQNVENSFLAQLIQHGLLIPSSVKGVYGRNGIFEDVLTRVDNLITTVGREPGTEVMRFPPVLSREVTEQSGYMKSFPHLLGSVHAFTGDHRQHRELVQDIEEHHDWTHHLSPSDVVLTPAACYPVYAAVAGTLPESGRLVDVSSYCFRHEPSDEPARMQSFRMREFVRIGEPEQVEQWRNQWIDRGLTFLRSLGLNAQQAPANDPFFGPGGRLLAASQQEQQLKTELLAPVNTEQPETAVMSLNYHQDHFAGKFNILTATAQHAHTACTGFGLERITLALFRAHGFDPTTWTAAVREILWP
ncbi:MAG TPA: amino acid--[acyl-carrier-protein] ligase [Dictyobacter sp.]|jgi:seryl-tRNA synthetase|nr:amino acid--[acyl-carrier-protein] ligase [Dictyobacter sp.]